MTNPIIQWNIRGLRSNIEKLKELYERYNPIAVCFQETFLISTDQISLKNCLIYRTEHGTNTRGSGVAIVVRSDVPSCIVNVTSCLEVTGERVSGTKSFTLCSLYVSLNYTLVQKELEGLLLQLPQPFILMGDLNGHNTL